MTIETVTMTRTVIIGASRQHILPAGTTADLRLAQAIDFCLHGYCVPTCGLPNRDNLPVVSSLPGTLVQAPGSSFGEGRG